MSAESTPLPVFRKVVRQNIWVIWWYNWHCTAADIRVDYTSCKSYINRSYWDRAWWL